MTTTRVLLILLGISSVAALGSGVAAWGFRGERDTARLALGVANVAARANAEALARAVTQHRLDMEAMAEDARRAQAAQSALATSLEALRNDTSHDSPAAAVLGRAVDLLRPAGADPGGAPPTPRASGGPAGVR